MTPPLTLQAVVAAMRRSPHGGVPPPSSQWCDPPPLILQAVVAAMRRHAADEGLQRDGAAALTVVHPL